MAFLAGASRGAVIAVRCPRCGTIQARARKPEGFTYECRACHATFTRAEGVAGLEQAKALRR
jgi:phage FluMu protein Com